MNHVYTNHNSVTLNVNLKSFDQETFLGFTYGLAFKLLGVFFPMFV